ncbi:MAG TPA: diguanylate cyclase [Gemmatimonadales bacterium]|nr:diguanylate cyclase [Gemmatimonadales bacterium]
MLFQINQAKCVACMACVRACPAEAVGVDGSAVSIIEAACVKCGMCVPACPHDAIDVAGDYAVAQRLARTGGAVLILGVEGAAHFYPRTPEQVVNACYQAGFQAVHRGVLGDELIAAEYLKLWASPGWSTMIRSTCPVVVETIRHDYPDLVPYLAQVDTPVAAEARYLKEVHGQDVPLVYAGVCLVEGGPDVAAVITFAELDRLLAERGVQLDAQPHTFTRIPEERRRHLSTAGGLPLPVLREANQASGRFRKVRGLAQLPALARAVRDGITLGFVDLLPCEGCLDHPLLGPKEELYWRRRVVGESEPPRSALPVLDPEVRVAVRVRHEAVTNGKRAAEPDVAAVIEKIGTAPNGRPWDCGACGYATCHAFAQAMLAGHATYRQCPPYQDRRLDEAQRQASVDELTGLATYRVLRERMANEIARSKRTGDRFAVVFVDLDQFKPLNDTFGHAAGNQVLEGVGIELSRMIRATDLAARFGGDEFVLVLVHTDAIGAKRVGEAVRQRVERLGSALGFGEIRVTASVGVSGYDPAQPDTDPLEQADKAVYEAKRAGGNAVR